MTTIFTFEFNRQLTEEEREQLIAAADAIEVVAKGSVEYLPDADAEMPTINEALSASFNETVDELFGYLGIDPNAKAPQQLVDPAAIAYASLTHLKGIFEDRVEALSPSRSMIQHGGTDPILVAEAISAVDAVERQLASLPALLPAEEPATEGKHAA